MPNLFKEVSGLTIAVVASVLLMLTLGFQGCGSSKSTDSGGGKNNISGSTQFTFSRIKASANGRSFKIQLSRKNITPSFVTSITVTRGGFNIGWGSFIRPCILTASIQRMAAVARRVTRGILYARIRLAPMRPPKDLMPLLAVLSRVA